MRQQVGAAIPPQWWDRLRGAQFGFVAGLVIGSIFGWFFHGVISMAIRFGLLMVLLLPLIVISWFWFRSRERQTQRSAQQTRGAGSSWRPGFDAGRPLETTQPSRPVSPLVDVPLIRSKSEASPDEIEAQLESLKRQRERTT